MAALVVAPPALDADAATGRVRPCLKKNVEAVKRTLQKKRVNIIADYAKDVDKWNIQLISGYLPNNSCYLLNNS